MNAPSPFRRVRIVLILSLCLNLLFVGAAGALWARWHFHPDEQTYRAVVRQLARRLDRDDARAMRAVFAQHRREILDARLAYRQSLQALLVVEQESPRDESKVKAAIAEARSRRIALGDALFEPALEGLQQLSPAGRAALLKAAR